MNMALVKKARNSHSIIATIEAIHNVMTGNYIFYTEQAIDSVIESWTNPYGKPAILHHKDTDGKTIGRVLHAEKRESVVKKGLYALVLSCRIADADAKKGIKDGRYLTTSVGVTGTDVECSICGHKISSGTACTHKRGQTYKDKLCYWIVHSMTAKEISFVIVPSDQYSQVISYYEEGKEDQPVVLKENLNDTSEPLAEQIQKGCHEMNLEEMQLALAEAKQKIESLEADNQTLNETNEQLKIGLAEKDQSLAQEVVLREGLETELSELKEMQKAQIIKKIITLRESLGLRTIEKSAFESKPLTSLTESLEDLEAELSFKESMQPTAQEPIAEPIAEPVQEPVVEPEQDVTALKEAQANNTHIVLNEQQPKVSVDAVSIVAQILN